LLTTAVYDPAWAPSIWTNTALGLRSAARRARNRLRPADRRPRHGSSPRDARLRQAAPIVGAEQSVQTFETERLDRKALTSADRRRIGNAAKETFTKRASSRRTYFRPLSRGSTGVRTAGAFLAFLACLTCLNKPSPHSQASHHAPYGIRASDGVDGDETRAVQVPHDSRADSQKVSACICECVAVLETVTPAPRMA